MLYCHIKKYFVDNMDLKVTDLATSLLLDFFAEKIAPYCYNMGVADSMKFISERTEDLYLLMKDE